MGFSVVPEIDDTPASDSDEIPRAARGHCLADEIEIGVLVPLTSKRWMLSLKRNVVRESEVSLRYSARYPQLAKPGANPDLGIAQFACASRSSLERRSPRA